MRRFSLILAGFILACLSISCNCTKDKPEPLSLDDLRGVTLDNLVQMREDILAKHADGSELSSVEADNVALLRDQERRLENGWIFGEWRERHGARLIFRDDGSVNVAPARANTTSWASISTSTRRSPRTRRSGRSFTTKTASLWS